MANMEDYLDWRGDLSFLADPFNEIDNLILSELVYTDFAGVVPEDGAAGETFAPIEPVIVTPEPPTPSPKPVRTSLPPLGQTACM